jgi:uncharacterized protein (TIGR02145 family)
MNKFNSVIIGDQEWMVKNLNVRTFRNGDPIIEMKTEEEWITAFENKLPAWCFFDNFAANGRKYGKLYNWFAANDPRGLAPVGWHVPDDSEWAKLIAFSGGDNMAGTKLKSKSGWDWDGNGSNESGFDALPGCYRKTDNGQFYGIEDDGLWWKDDGFWWSSTEYDSCRAWLLNLNCNSGIVSRYAFNKGCGISIRCIKDKPVLTI